jgi:hypothetical protein
VPRDPEIPLEQISPELVLVDPELARAERARLTERAWLTEWERGLTERAEPAAPFDAAALRLAVERTLQQAQDTPSHAEHESARAGRANQMRVLEVLLVLSLLANGLALALIVTNDGKEEASRAAFSVPSAGAASATDRSATARATMARTQSSPAPEARRLRPAATLKATIERRILAELVQAPSQKLPAALIDPTTGLAKNNLQVACRRTHAASSLRCVVRHAGDKGGNRVYVSYRGGLDGRGALSWGRPR